MSDEIVKENSYAYEIGVHVKQAIDDFKKDLRYNTEKTEQILVQATKTNGRVNGLEAWSTETKSIVENLVTSIEKNKDSIIAVKSQSDTEIALLRKDHKSDKNQVIIAVSIIVFFLGGFIGLGLVDLKNYVKETTNEKVNNQQELLIDKTADKVVTALEARYNLQITK